MRLGDAAGAAADCRRALVLDPDNVYAQQYLAEASREPIDTELAGLPGEARVDVPGDKDCVSVVIATIDSLSSAEALYNIGVEKLDQGDFVGAIDAFDESILIDPMFARALYNRGNAQFGRGQLESAVDDYGHALRLDPQHTRAYSNRGHAKLGQGDITGAIEV